MSFDIAQYKEQLAGLALPSGGFKINEHLEARTDATAWAVIALASSSGYQKIVNSGRDFLAGVQTGKGALPIKAGLIDAFWPTSLGVMAWLKSPKHDNYLNKALDFLLESEGTRIPLESAGVVGHDTMLKGWPWTAGAHSWIEPTSLAVLALKSAGLDSHARCREAIRLLLDRQLTTGGWNYGNTTVFGAELRPMPETTGMALTALAGSVEFNQVSAGIDYLKKELIRLQTPLTVSWSLFALSAWDQRPAGAREMISEVFKRQDSLGAFDAVLLSSLIIAHQAEEGLLHFLTQ